MDVQFNPWNVPNLEVFNFYCCPECDSKHDTKSHFVEHALEFHPKAKDFLPQMLGFELNQDQTFVIPEDVKSICDISDEDLILSDTKNELMCDKDLIISDKREVMCDICFSMFESIDALRDHIEINHEVKIQELFDIATVTDNINFESVTEDVKIDLANIESITEENYDNTIPRPPSVDPVTIKIMKIQKKIDNKDQEKSLFKCDKCDKAFKTKGFYLNHLQNKHEKQAKIIEKKRPSTSKTVTKTQNVKTKKVEIVKAKKVTNVKIKKAENLKANKPENVKLKQVKNVKVMKVENVKVKKVENVKVKKVENVKTKEMGNVKTKKVENVKTKEIENVKIKKGENVKVKKVESPKKAKLDQKENENTFICKICDKGFKSNFNLKRHNQLLHEKNFNCKKCTKKFKSPVMLSNHMKQAHRNAKTETLMCNKCSFFTGNEILMQNHMKQNHQNEKSETFKCQQCSYFTGNRILMQKHINNQH